MTGEVLYPAEAFFYGGKANVDLPSNTPGYRERPGNPETQAGINVELHLPEAVSASSFGANYFSEAWADRARTVSIPEATMFNAGLTWENELWNMRVNGYNVTDEQCLPRRRRQRRASCRFMPGRAGSSRRSGRSNEAPIASRRGRQPIGSVTTGYLPRMRKAAPLGLAMFAMLDGTAGWRNLAISASSRIKTPAVPTLVTDGSVVVAFTIRANGRVDDAVTLAATEPRARRLRPRRGHRVAVRSRPGVSAAAETLVPSQVLRREIVEFVFKRDGVVTSLSHFDSAKGWFPPEQRPLIRLVQSDETRSAIRSDCRCRRATQRPQLSRTLAAAGNVAVSYVIDETGKVRVPIVEWTDDVGVESRWRSQS